MHTFETHPVTKRPSALNLGVGLHLGRLLVLAALFGVLIAHDHDGFAALVAPAIFFAAFAFAHDLAHGSLGLSRSTGDALLAATAALMLISGHGMRATHLLHHRRPLSPEDVEGAAARVGFVRAVAQSPRLWWSMRVEAFRRARRRDQRRVLIETAVNCGTALVLGAAGTPGLVYLAMAVALQILMPVWAGHLSHRPPKLLLHLARALAFTRSPTVLSLAFHDLHHQKPTIPCHRLAEG